MREIDIVELAAVVDAGGVVVDVRESAEYAEGHVPGARSLPMSGLTARLDDLDDLGGGAPVHLVCASGNRSAAMAEVLTARGFDAVNVRGGTTAWVQSGRPVERGRVTGATGATGKRMVAPPGRRPHRDADPR